MRYYHDCDLEEFPWWSGAQVNFQDLKKHEQAYQWVEALLDDITTDDRLSMTEVNDFMWFDLEDYLIENNFKDCDGNWLD